MGDEMMSFIYNARCYFNLKDYDRLVGGALGNPGWSGRGYDLRRA